MSIAFFSHTMASILLEGPIQHHTIPSPPSPLTLIFAAAYLDPTMSLTPILIVVPVWWSCQGYC